MKRAPKLQVYRAADGWRWRVRGRNSLILADGGQSYSRKRAAQRGAQLAHEARGAALGGRA
jgi:uncharacterized protein YegP (UPF0339 family)